MRVVVLWVVDVSGRESAPGKGRVWQWCVKLRVGGACPSSRLGKLPSPGQVSLYFRGS